MLGGTFVKPSLRLFIGLLGLGLLSGLRVQAIEPAAQNYLNTFLTLLEANYVFADKVDWAAFRAKALEANKDAKTEADTHQPISKLLEGLGSTAYLQAPGFQDAPQPGIGVITTGGPRWIIKRIHVGGSAERAGLRIGDKITLVNGNPPPTDPKARLYPQGTPKVRLRLERYGQAQPIEVELEVGPYNFAVVAPPLEARRYGKIGYVSVTEASSEGPMSGAAYATLLQNQLRTLERESTCGVVVDVRLNYDAEVWPALAGLGPLLGEGKLGSLQERAARNEITYRTGKLALGSSLKVNVPEAYAMKNPNAPVAVLFGEQSLFSGENIALAFRGRANTRFFGEDTTGYTTHYTWFPLPDGASFFIPTGVPSDRNNEAFDDTVLKPDEPVTMDWARYGSNDDPVINAALGWLRSLDVCK